MDECHDMYHLDLVGIHTRLTTFMGPPKLNICYMIFKYTRNKQSFDFYYSKFLIKYT